MIWGKKKIKKNQLLLIVVSGKFLGESICKISENYLAIGVKSSILIIDLKKLKRIKEYNLGLFCWNLCVFENYLFCGTNKIIYKFIINEDKLDLKKEIKLAREGVNCLIKLNKKTMVLSQKDKILIYHLNEI